MSSDDIADPVGTTIAKSAGEAMAAKAKMPWSQMAVLSVAAGAFIAFGGIAFLIAQAANGAIEGSAQILSGFVFSVGLILVMITGTELFTGNTMMALSTVQRRLSVSRLLGAWGVAWIGNLVGSLVIAWLFVTAGGPDGLDGGIAAVAGDLAKDKVDKAPLAIVASGILANMLVCLAVWMAMGAKTLPAKVVAIVGPVTIFVAGGFEHSVANMGLLPIGWASAEAGAITIGPVLVNLAFSTIGNIIGGVAVALCLAKGHDAIDAASQ